MSARRLTAILALLLGAAGCAKDHCKDLPASFQLDLRLMDPSRGAEVRSLAVLLVVGENRWRRVYNLDRGLRGGATSLSVRIEPPPTTNFDLEITARVHTEPDAGGTMIGEGVQRFSATPDGCNELMLAIRTVARPDSGVDAGSMPGPDGAPADAEPEDQGLDAQRVDADAGPADARPDARIDSGPDAGEPTDADAGPIDIGPIDIGFRDARPTDEGFVMIDQGFRDTGPPDMGFPDATPPDEGFPDAPPPPDEGFPDAPPPPDMGFPDAEPADEGFPDAPPPPDMGFLDATPPDLGFPDATTPDLGFPDATPPDVGFPDAHAPDAAPAETGGQDASGSDVGARDAGVRDTGARDASGASGPFEYPPSNFDPNRLEDNAGNEAELSCGVTSFDSVTLAFENWCGAEAPPIAIEAQLKDGQGAVVLAMRRLAIAAGSRLELWGDRRVILAVFGEAEIDGEIVAIDGSAIGGDEEAAAVQISAARALRIGGRVSAGGGGVILLEGDVVEVRPKAVLEGARRIRINAAKRCAIDGVVTPKPYGCRE